MAVVDFSAPSRLPRFHIIDLLSGRQRALLVAHGRGSDPDHSGWLEHFSNAPGSQASSAGAYLTGDLYIGKHGRSRRLMGLDPGNSNAEARAIVIHAASYVTPALAAEVGKLGRSEGCLAVAQDNLEEILATLGSGRLIYVDKV
ncbi:murein L,D-transpeptidase catalytic domain family protein [Sphingobium sp. BYY-5]|uniref:murein L,D-transpeptidase catalytic domain family protein n=1 Tax=Sphingobium sp. BYY-5 TaxID=2926400 RepID=UPI001FA6DA4D|nr:murein L,D-transpeptidase catalytic domain family protein [Sphingobium sp. BYY-5]